MFKQYIQMSMIALFTLNIFANCSSPSDTEEDPEPAFTQTVYVGTYTYGGSEGIYIYDLDVESGELSQKHVVGNINNPSFLTLDSQNRYLYAVQENGNNGAVTAFAIDSETDNLTALNTQPSHGSGPCHVVVDATDDNVIVSNYSSGSVAIYPAQQDGSLGEAGNVQQHSGSSINRQRQEGPHAHSTTVSPDGKYAYTCDLGIDKIMIYEISNGQLQPNDPEFTRIQAGAGPRHFTFHPNGKFAYVINELNATITLFDYRAASGALVIKKTVKTLPSDFTGSNKCADIHITPDGKFLYGSNRGHDSLAIFSINEETGELTLIGYQSVGGSAPRNFGIDPTGKLILVANQDSNNIVVFEIQENGELTQINSISVSMPVCVKFMQR